MHIPPTSYLLPPTACCSYRRDVISVVLLLRLPCKRGHGNQESRRRDRRLATVEEAPYDFDDLLPTRHKGMKG